MLKTQHFSTFGFRPCRYWYGGRNPITQPSGKIHFHRGAVGASGLPLENGQPGFDTTFKQLYVGWQGVNYLIGPGTSGGTYAQEIPAGTIDGTNAVFTLAHTPAQAASLQVFLNGLPQSQVAGNFTLAGNAITFAGDTIPQPGDSLAAAYIF